MEKKMTLALAAALAWPLGARGAEKESVEEQLRRTLGSGAVETLEGTRAQDPELHRSLRRALRLVLDPQLGLGEPGQRARQALSDPEIRSVLIRNLAARFRLWSVLRGCGQGAAKGDERVRLDRALGEAYDAKVAALEARARALERQSQAMKDQRAKALEGLAEDLLKP